MLSKGRWSRERRSQAARSLFFGNYFCLIPHSDAAFVAVSKNAVTFLKKVALYAATGNWPTDDADVHAAIGYDDRSAYLVEVADLTEFERTHGRRRRFAVWRDPVARVESTYALFCLEAEPRDNFAMFDLQRSPSLDRFREFCELEWSKPDPRTQDEHLRAQADYYHAGDVDDVVAIPALNRYLTEHGIGFVPERTNATGSGFRLTDPDFVARIHQVYARDYAIEVTHR